VLYVTFIRHSRIKDYGRARIELTNLSAQLDARTVREPVVQQVKFKATALGQQQAFGHRVRGDNLKLGKAEGDQLASVVIIIDEQDAFFVRHRNRVYSLWPSRRRDCEEGVIANRLSLFRRRTPRNAFCMLMRLWFHS